MSSFLHFTETIVHVHVTACDVRSGDALRARMRGLRGVDVLDGLPPGDGSAEPASSSGPPDVVLLEVGPQNADTLAIVRQAATERRAVPVLVMTHEADRMSVLRTFQAGATGALHQDAGDEVVHCAVRAVARGETFLCPMLTGDVVEAYLRGLESGDAPSDILTPRQRQVLQMVGRGLTTKGIARELGLSVKTIESHRAEIMRRLGVRHMAGLVREAVRMGLLTEDF